jgi:hypothetical protein
MIRNRIFRILNNLVLIALVFLFACGKDESSRPADEGRDRVPDFIMQDWNPNSARYLESVSPRDYLGQVSCWYFTAAT